MANSMALDMTSSSNVLICRSMATLTGYIRYRSSSSKFNDVKAGICMPSVCSENVEAGPGTSSHELRGKLRGSSYLFQSSFNSLGWKYCYAAIKQADMHGIK